MEPSPPRTSVVAQPRSPAGLAVKKPSLWRREPTTVGTVAVGGILPIIASAACVMGGMPVVDALVLGFQLGVPYAVLVFFTTKVRQARERRKQEQKSALSK